MKVMLSLWNEAYEETKADPKEYGVLTEDVAEQGVCLRFTASREIPSCCLSVEMEVPDWKREDYLLIPAAVYDGNRYDIRHITYAPMFTKEDWGRDLPPTITDVPHLNQNGDGVIALRAGDSSTPGAFLYLREEKKMLSLLYPCMGTKGENGIRITETEQGLTLTVQSPAVRNTGMYRFPVLNSSVPCEDKTAHLMPGETLELVIRTQVEPAETLSAFYDRVLEICHREPSIAGVRSLADTISLSQAFRRIEDKYNTHSYHTDGFYCVGENTSTYSCWQTGWVGGINAVYSLYKEGSALTKERALSTMDFMFDKIQAPSGFFYGIYKDGTYLGDDFYETSNTSFAMTRKCADALYFAALTMLQLKKEGAFQKELWIQGLKKAADAFVRLFRKEGQLGQFLDVDTDEILIRNSAAGGMVPAGLILCAGYFEDPSYLKAAEEIGAYYYRDYVTKGLANGGPGEILSAPDSESAYALVESFVMLYEATGKAEYLKQAEEAACIYTTWIESYDYPFPKGSTFGDLNMQATGAVWANIQNKHGAPGPCTHSGSGLLRLGRYTGKERYFELAQRTSHNISQYLSREDQPLWNYAHDKVSPSGFMCERVSTCDWEGYDKIGGVYETGCWCEATNLCIYTDIPGIWCDLEKGRMFINDSIDVAIHGQELILTNTRDEEKVITLFEDEGQWKQGDLDYREGMKKITVPAGGSETVYVKGAYQL